MRYKIFEKPVEVTAHRLLRILDGKYDKQYTLVTVQEEESSRWDETVLVVIRDTWHDTLLGSLITFDCAYQYMGADLAEQTAAAVFDLQPFGVEFHPVKPVPVEVTVYDFEEVEQ